jgi:rSAM/selenodomain-associated transferase 1
LTTPILVFAKSPVPGEVKTRLIPALGAAGAAALHERLTDRALATAAAAAVGPVELCCTPDASHPVLVALARAHAATLAQQGPGNLGDRMHAAFARALAGAPAAIVIGCDCPVLTSQHLREAAAVLAGGADAVLAPAEDGGYVLVGLARPEPSLFAGIAWGGPDVLEHTRRRLAALGWRSQELETLWDVDRPADVARIRRDIAGGAALVDGP